MKIVFKEKVYIGGDRNIHTYRIPSIIKTKSGTLLAFCEGRKEGRGDSGCISLLVKRSEDQGRNWSEQTVVASDGMNTFGNCNPVVDSETGRIHAVCNFNYADIDEVQIRAGKGIRDCYHLFSDDDGVTWSTPRNITSTTKRPGWSWHAIGPCHGIQTKSGRFVFGCNHANLSHATTSENYDGYSFSIYSDDGCETFKISPDISSNTNECSVAQLSDGRLYMNMRTQQYNHRFVAYSHDEGETWTDFHADTTLVDPCCQGSTLILSDSDTLVFCNAASLSRANLTIRLSSDAGQTWSESIVVHEGPAAYSDLVQIDDNTIGCLYEFGDTDNCYQYIGFALIALK
jgi:sialidase-1